MTYSVDLSALDALVARLTGLDGYLEQELAGLDSRMAQLQSTWLGEAADEQGQAHERWRAGARRMQVAMTALGAAARAAHANYSAAGAANARMWR